MKTWILLGIALILGVSVWNWLVAKRELEEVRIHLEHRYQPLFQLIEEHAQHPLIKDPNKGVTLEDLSVVPKLVKEIEEAIPKNDVYWAAWSYQGGGGRVLFAMERPGGYTTWDLPVSRNESGLRSLRFGSSRNGHRDLYVFEGQIPDGGMPRYNIAFLREAIKSQMNE